MIRALIYGLLLACTLHARASKFSVVYAGDFHADYPGGDAASLSDMLVLSNWLTNHFDDGVYNAKVLVSSGDLFEQTATTAPAGRLTITNLLSYFADWKAHGYRIWLTPGNHDADELIEGCFGIGMGGTNVARAWTNVFPLSFFSSQVGFVTNSPHAPFGGTNDSKQVVMTFTNAAGTVKLLWLPYHHSITNALYVSGDPFVQSSYTFPSMLPQVTQQTDWLKSVAAHYPDHMVIMGAHWMVTVNRQRPAPFQAYIAADNLNSGAAGYIGWPMPVGRLPIDAGALGVTNLLCFLTGHSRQGIFGSVSMRGAAGQPVRCELHNYQSTGEAGRIILVLTFDDVTRKVRFRSINLVTDTILRESAMPFSYPHQKRLIFR